MAGETHLQKLLGSMKPELLPGTYVFATVPHDFGGFSELKPVMMFREAEGLTLIAQQDAAERAGLKITFACRMITLQIHSSLEAVGFLAAITTKLAACGIGVNPVSAFHHDHLFVSVDHAEQVMSLLHELAAENAE